MAFPSKNLKIATKIPVASDIKSRKEFVEDLPLKVRNTVRGVDLTLINEAILAISAGHATINGKGPKNRAEMYILIASYFTTARTNLHMYFNGAENITEDYTVVVKYKDQPVTIKFPSGSGN
jgi:hypothetical protein